MTSPVTPLTLALGLLLCAPALAETEGAPPPDAGSPAPAAVATEPTPAPPDRGAAEPAAAAAPAKPAEAAAPPTLLPAPELPSAAAKAASPLLSAKWGKGVAFRSPGGDFELSLRGRMQLRGTFAFPGEGSTGKRYDEFVVRRARLVVRARYTEEWHAYLQLAFSNQDMEPDAPNVLRDANATWARFRDLNVRVGQMKVPFDRQRVISSSAQQFADRSIVVGELNLDRDVGLQLRSDDLFGWGKRLSYQLGVFSGDGRNRLAAAPGLLFVARVQLAPLGGFDDFSDTDFERSSALRLAVAGAYARNNLTRRDRSTFSTTLKNGFVTYDHATADLLLKWRGLSLLSQFLWRQADRDRLDGADGSVEWTRSALGYFVQAGFLTPWGVEIAARWGDLIPAPGTSPALHRQRELGGALSWYALGHDLKLQVDYFYLPGLDFAAGNHQLRAQLQLYF